MSVLLKFSSYLNVRKKQWLPAFIFMVVVLLFLIFTGQGDLELLNLYTIF